MDRRVQEALGQLAGSPDLEPHEGGSGGRALRLQTQALRRVRGRPESLLWKQLAEALLPAPSPSPPSTAVHGRSPLRALRL